MCLALPIKLRNIQTHNENFKKKKNRERERERKEKKRKRVPARRAGVSLGEALKRTKEGSDGDGGRYDPTSISLAVEDDGVLRSRSRGSRATPLKNSLLRVF